MSGVVDAAQSEEFKKAQEIADNDKFDKGIEIYQSEELKNKDYGAIAGTIGGEVVAEVTGQNEEGEEDGG